MTTIDGRVRSRWVWIGIGICAFGWGTSGVAARSALTSGVGPLWLAVARSAVAALATVPVMWFLGRRLPGRGLLGVGSAMAVLNVIAPYVFINLALGSASSGYVYVILALTPLSVAILAHLFLGDERLNRWKVIALLVGFAGATVLVASGDAGLGAAGDPFVAAAFAGGAVVALSSSSVVFRRWAGDADAIDVTAVSFAVGTPVLVALAVVFEPGGAGLVADVVWEVAYLAIVGSVVPYVFLYMLLRRVGTGLTSTVGYLAPLVAAVSGALVLDERITAAIAGGAILIVAGAVMMNRAGRLTAPAAPPTGGLSG